MYLSLAVVILAGAVRHWLYSLGGLGLILIGLADNSVVPLPGSMDVFTILLTANNKEWWWYYALMATIGAVIGGYLTYRLAVAGGKETLEKKIGKRRSEKVYRKFEKRGFASVMVGAMLPPPFPIVPVLMAAGALQYPTKKFLSALAIGRGIRFTIVAILGKIYGRAIIGFFSQYYKPVLYILIGLAVLGGIAALVYFKWYRPRHKTDQDKKAPAPVGPAEHHAA